MAYRRSSIPFFELANAAYTNSVVSFFQVDPVTFERLTTLVTLYAGKTGTTQVANPVTLDASGKFSVPVYTDERTIAVVADVDGQVHDTGIWEPALSTADVDAAAASAVSSAASATAAAQDASDAAASEAAAAASAAAALAAVGTVKVQTTDGQSEVLNSKITVVAPVTKTPQGGAGVTQTLQISVAAATEAATGVMRFATAAEVTTGTVTTAAVTPAGLAAGLGSTIGNVTALAGAAYTEVTSGANVLMTSGSRYRFTATTAAAVRLKNTMGVGDFHIVEFGCTTAATMTVTLNGNTSIDGAAASDTSTRYGDVIMYYCPTSAGVVRTRWLESLPK